MECSSDFTRVQMYREPVWALQSASASSNAQADEFGLSRSLAEVRRFSLSFPDSNQVDQRSRVPVAQIVLVEDNKADVGLVREALEEYKITCDVAVVADGERAIRFFLDVKDGDEPCPDLMIVDLGLPKKSGKEVLTCVRTFKICEQVPLIVLTSSASQQDKEDVAKFHPRRFLTKPTLLEDFIKLGAIFREVLRPTQ